jgi:hypothetical protein
MMKKNFYFLLMAVLVCGLSLSVTSCKDDDKNNDDEGEVFTDGPQDTQDETVAKFWNVVGELVDKDDITDDYKGKTFDPIIGIEDPDNPQARIVYTNSPELAAERFAHLVDIDPQLVTEETPSYIWNDPDIGTMTYTKGDGNTAWATVDVKIQQVPKLEKIIFRSITQGDENASKEAVKGGKRAYYRFGDIIAATDQNLNAVAYWICVRPAFNPEGKGDSHWISVSPLPQKNLYTWKYENVNKKKKINVKRTYVLPTGLGTYEEHMQNFAELLFAILHPGTWQDNVNKYASCDKKGKPTGMRMFHDFHSYNVKYHNKFFWQNLRFQYYDEKLFEKVFGMSFDDMKQIVDKDGLYLLYNGKTWKSGNAPTLYQAHYFNTPGGVNANMQTKKPLSQVKKAVYDKNDPSKDIELDVSTCTMEKPYYINEKFFGDSHPRFIIRHATAAELHIYKKYDNREQLQDYYEVYRYYGVHKEDGDTPEETEGNDDWVDD